MIRPASVLPALLPLLAVALTAAPGPASAAPRAAGGVKLLEAMESSPATVVAQVVEPVRLDRHAFGAGIRVETALHGPLEAGDRARIAWEELAESRAPRFADGDRILVSLVRLPGASIWRQRIPDDQERSGALGVAMRGDAFLRRPSIGSVGVLQHYLALGGQERAGSAGAGYLVDLVAGAELPLAKSAVERLEGLPGLEEMLGERSGPRLARALLRGEADDAFRRDLVGLIGSRSLESARPALEAMAASQPPPPPQVFEALAALEGGVSGWRLAALLEDAPVEQRLVAARHASGPEAEDTLVRLLASDPAPEVRAAAASRLVELEGEQALEPLLRGLADPESSVRVTAARHLAGLGEPAVPRLRQVVEANDTEAAAAAVVALGLSPAPGARAALVEISTHHANAGLRALADIALGRPLGHRD